MVCVPGVWVLGLDLTVNDEPCVWRVIARLRMPAGFVCGAFVLWLAEPTSATLWPGGVVAAFGEALRVWSAGHLNKGREITRSGPYRFMRHPLYAGSALMGLGLAIAARAVPVALIVAAYLGIMLTAAIRTEEASLRLKFGDEYDAYRDGRIDPASRRFSVERALANREYRAIVGLVVAMAVLAWKR